jgi:peptide/nickel transport system substrate-binding protein
VKFHNVDDFNADAVKFTLDRATNPETKATISSEVSTIAGTEIVDAFTVNVSTKTPDFLMPVRLGELFGLMLSRKHTDAAGKETIATRPNGTGPFKLVAWAKNERMVLEANDNYWRGAPKVKTIVVRPILEDAARIAALQTGEVDLIAPVPHVRIAELQRNDKLVIKTIAAPRIFHVTIDVRKPPFDNVKVRQALNHAVDVNAILKTLYFGHGTRLATVVDKGALGYDPSIQPYPYDPNKAKALLAEAGFPNGFEVEFDSFTGSIADHSRPAEAIVGYLQKVGIKVKPNVFEFSAFGPRRVQNKTAPLFIYSIGDAYLEPSWVIRWLTQGGLGMHYKSARLDDMLTRIEATDDPKKRAPQYSDVQKLIKDEAPFIFLYQADAAFGMSARVDYTPRPDETQWLYPLGLKG